VDLRLFGADDAPAALGLDPPDLDHGGGLAVTEAAAMCRLQEPVPGGHRTNPERLEQDVEVAGRHR